jgi:hypothetical protein
MLKKLIIIAGMASFSVTNCHALSTGDSYGGGTVFCVSDTPEEIKDCRTAGEGSYGLIMANEDQMV